MNVPLESTQPPAEQLVSYEEFLSRLQKLTSSPRVRVEKAGESHGGRGIYVILISDAEASPTLERHKSLSTALQTPDVIHPTLFQLQKAERAPLGEHTKFAVLIAGLSFGHEAAHVEGHLQLAERLAWREDDDVSAILGRLIVLIMPMVNPDGRVMSIEAWKRYPLTEDSSAGNLYGFYLNRDFLHLTQPETKAVLKVYRDWHPIALLDTHEDVFCLGVQVPEVCWCPYSGQSKGEEAPQNITEIVGQLAEAIRKEWHRLGFEYFQQDMFAHPMPGEPEEGPYWMSSGNVVQTMLLHGIPSVITESGRTPGVQTWEHRVQQKYSAALALLKELAKDPAGIAEKIYGNREQAIEEALASEEAFVVPKQQRELAAVAQLVNTLLQHGVRVYETENPYKALVVPLSQSEGEVARILLSAPESKVVAMPPALGVAVAEYQAVAKERKDALRKAALRPVMESPVPAVIVKGDPNAPHYAIPNSIEGIRLVNRLWGIGSMIHWLSEPVEVRERLLEKGTFVVEGSPSGAVQRLAQGLAVEIHGLPNGTRLESYSLRRPKVALYAGQGVDRPDASARADIWWALEQLGFEFVPLRAEDVTKQVFRRFDTLMVPGGDAREIVHGWNEDALLNKSPWELPGEPRGIGQEGLDAIRSFVERGGGYLGIGSGGGLLALKEYAGLVDLEIIAHSLGSARVLLRVDEPNHPLMFGLNGYYDEAGQWAKGFFPAYYHSETFTDTPGGPIFGPDRDSTVLASYYHVDHDPSSLQVVQESYLTEAEGGIAIASQRVGNGQATVMGIRPGFRAVWTNTWKLLGNAVFLSPAQDPQAGTLF